jgi:hypothetical protein
MPETVGEAPRRDNPGGEELVATPNRNSHQPLSCDLYREQGILDGVSPWRKAAMFANCALVIATVWGPTSAAGAAPRPDDKKATEKTHAVYFENAKWSDVFDWYSRVTEQKADVVSQPKGTVTLNPGRERRFTSAEITDLLNELLMEQKLLLIPNRRSFAVVTSEGKIDPKLIPFAELADLGRLARSALVEVAIPVTIDLDDEIADEITKCLTPIGQLVSTKGMSVVVRDTVDNVLRLRSLLTPL